MIATHRRYFIQSMAIPFSALALAISSTPAPAATLEHLIPRRRPVSVALLDTRTEEIVRTGEFVGDPHAVRLLKRHPTDGHQQAACPGFRNGEWAQTTTDRVHYA